LIVVDFGDVVGFFHFLFSTEAANEDRVGSRLISFVTFSLYKNLKSKVFKTTTTLEPRTP